MAYSSFTLSQVSRTFQLETFWQPALFADIEPVEPSEELTAVLKRNLPFALAMGTEKAKSELIVSPILPFALAMGTEKAKSELIVSPILIELCLHFNNRVSLFSGIDFNVDAESGLTGVCDFLVSLSPQLVDLEAPAIILVEAKKDSLTDGLGQCVAEMVAAQRFNAEKGNDIPCVYGATTSGTEWLFLKLEGQTLSVDLGVYQLAECARILGILTSMVSQQA